MQCMYCTSEKMKQNEKSIGPNSKFLMEEVCITLEESHGLTEDIVESFICPQHQLCGGYCPAGGAKRPQRGD